jgi:putative peptidoglycan lipid II flippase
MPKASPAEPPAPQQLNSGNAHSRVIRSAGVVGAAVFLSRITGLVREIVFANFFGAGSSFVYDAFVTAFRIPNLFRDLLAEGALSAAFVSVFSRELETKGDSAARHLYNLLTTVLIPFVGLLCLGMIVFMPEIVSTMAPGFAHVPGKTELTIQMARIMTPFLLFIALAAKAMGALNAKGKFGVPALASACFNIVSVAAGLAIGFWLGPIWDIEPIVGMACGALLGGVAQYVVQIPSLRAEGLRFRFALDVQNPALRKVLLMMLPAVIGAAAVQINVVVNTNFASQLVDDAGNVMDGPVSWLGYAFRFMQLPLGLFGVAIASATLPAISRSAAAGRMDEFRETLSRSLGLVFLLTVPAAVGLVVLREPIVGLIYERGEFTAHDTQQTAAALAYYCIGLAAYAAVKVLTPAYYALGDVRVPVAVAALSVGLNYGLNWYFIRALGWDHASLALSTSLVATLNFLLLFWFMRNKTDGLMGRRLAGSLAKIFVAAAGMGACCWLVARWLQDLLGMGFVGRAATVMAAVSVGVVILYGLCVVLRVSELEAARRAVLGRFSRTVSKG